MTTQREPTAVPDPSSATVSAPLPPVLEAVHCTSFAASAVPDDGEEEVFADQLQPASWRKSRWDSEDWQ